MTKILDGFGKPCPKPLVMAKKELDAGTTDLAIQVDNETAVKNISRLASKKGLGLSVDEIEGGWLLTFQEGAGAGAGIAVDVAATLAAGSACGVGGGAGCGYAVFVGKDHIGAPEGELGHNLLKMAIYTLAESDDTPASLLFMNSGVKLPAGSEAEVITNLKTLEEKGCEILVCGTCLDFYGLKESLQVGEVSNMYDILGRMQEASKVITL